MCRLYQSKSRGTYTRLCWWHGTRRGVRLPGDHLTGTGSRCVPKTVAPRRKRAPSSGLPRCTLCGQRRPLSIDTICQRCEHSANGRAYLAHKRQNQPRAWRTP